MISVTQPYNTNRILFEYVRNLNVTKERKYQKDKLTCCNNHVIIIVDGGTEPQTLSAFSGHQRCFR